MNEEHPIPAAEREAARVTALVLGQLGDYEAAELEARIADNPALAELRREIEAAHRLLGQIETEERKVWKLSRRRRKRLLAVLHSSHHTPCDATHEQPEAATEPNPEPSPQPALRISSANADHDEHRTECDGYDAPRDGYDARRRRIWIRIGVFTALAAAILLVVVPLTPKAFRSDHFELGGNTGGAAAAAVDTPVDFLHEQSGVQVDEIASLDTGPSTPESAPADPARPGIRGRAQHDDSLSGPVAGTVAFDAGSRRVSGREFGISLGDTVWVEEESGGAGEPDLPGVTVAPADLDYGFGAAVDGTYSVQRNGVDATDLASAGQGLSEDYDNHYDRYWKDTSYFGFDGTTPALPPAADHADFGEPGVPPPEAQEPRFSESKRFGHVMPWNGFGAPGSDAPPAPSVVFGTAPVPAPAQPAAPVETATGGVHSRNNAGFQSAAPDDSVRGSKLALAVDPIDGAAVQPDVNAPVDSFGDALNRTWTATDYAGNTAGPVNQTVDPGALRNGFGGGGGFAGRFDDGDGDGLADPGVRITGMDPHEANEKLTYAFDVTNADEQDLRNLEILEDQASSAGQATPGAVPPDNPADAWGNNEFFSKLPAPANAETRWSIEGGGALGPGLIADFERDANGRDGKSSQAAGEGGGAGGGGQAGWAKGLAQEGREPAGDPFEAPSAFGAVGGDDAPTAFFGDDFRATGTGGIGGALLEHEEAHDVHGQPDLRRHESRRDAVAKGPVDSFDAMAGGIVQSVPNMTRESAGGAFDAPGAQLGNHFTWEFSPEGEVMRANHRIDGKAEQGRTVAGKDLERGEESVEELEQVLAEDESSAPRGGRQLADKQLAKKKEVAERLSAELATTTEELQRLESRTRNLDQLAALNELESKLEEETERIADYELGYRMKRNAPGAGAAEVPAQPSSGLDDLFGVPAPPPPPKVAAKPMLKTGENLIIRGTTMRLEEQGGPGDAPPSEPGESGVTPVTPETTAGERPQPTSEEVLDEMDRILIPELSFKDADIYDVANFLIETSRARDSLGDPGLGVNIIIDAKNAPTPAGEPIPAPRVTLVEQNVSLRRALDKVGEQAGLTYTVKDGVVIARQASGGGTGVQAPSGELGAKDRQVLDMLEKTNVPELDLKDMSPDDVLALLSETARPRDRAADKGVALNYILDVPWHDRAAPAASKDEDDNDDFFGGSDFGFDSVPQTSTSPGRGITMNVRRVSLRQAVELAAEAAGMEIVVKKGTVVLQPKRSSAAKAEDTNANRSSAAKAEDTNESDSEQLRRNLLESEKLSKLSKGFDVDSLSKETISDRSDAAYAAEAKLRVEARALEANADQAGADSSQRLADLKQQIEELNAQCLALEEREVELERPLSSTVLLGGKDRIEDTLDRVVVPQMSFRDADVHTVLQYLEAVARARDPRGEGIPLAVDLHDFQRRGSRTTESPKITINVRNVSLADALDFVSDIADLRYRIDDDKVEVRPYNSVDKTQTRFFKVSPELLASLGLPVRADGAAAVDVRAMLEYFGISSPNGTQAIYQPEYGTMVVVNSPEMLVGVARILRELEKVESKNQLGHLASEEPFSTFSLHVSDVSFQQTRNELAAGRLPEPASVRTEDFVNAFDYGDPRPRPAERVGCRIEQCAHPFRPSRNLVRIAIATAATGRNQQQPLHLTLLLDVSGSMEREDRRASLLEAIRVLGGHLGPHDRVTLIGFSRQARLLAEGLSGAQAEELLRIVRATPSEGGTNLEDALDLAAAKAAEHFDPQAMNRIVLLTDGAANLGDARPEELARRVVALRQRGIAFDACGIGSEELNDELLEEVTRKGDGRYYVLNQPADAGPKFARQLAGALRPAAKNVKVQVVFNPERVGRYRLLGFQKHRLKKEDFRNDKVDAAELAAAEAGVAVYEVEVKPEGEGPLGEVFTRFRDLAADRMLERSWSIQHSAAAPRFEESPVSMQLAGSAALLAETLRGGPDAALVDLEVLARCAQRARVAMPGSERAGEFETMVRQVRRLAAE